MANIFNRVAVAIATTGTGTVTFGSALDTDFLTPSEAGAVDADTPWYLLEEGGDFEIGQGTVGGSVTTLARTTVIVSKIGGTVGTSKMNLAGSATLRFVEPAEAWLAENIPGFIYGLELANGTDSDHDIDFTTGQATDDTNAVSMSFSSAITKQFDATFAEGTAAGGMASGESLPTSGTIHIWAIAKADGTTDFFANNHATSGLSPTLPSGFIYKRRIASLITDGSANIRGFSQRGDEFLLSTVAAESNDSDPGTSAYLKTLTHVPAGVKVDALLTIRMADTSVGTVTTMLVTSPDQADIAPSAAGAFTIVVNALSEEDIVNMEVRTNTSRQVRNRLSQSTADHVVNWIVKGWIDAP